MVTSDECRGSSNLEEIFANGDSDLGEECPLDSEDVLVMCYKMTD